MARNSPIKAAVGRNVQTAVKDLDWSRLELLGQNIEVHELSDLKTLIIVLSPVRNPKKFIVQVREIS